MYYQFRNDYSELVSPEILKFIEEIALEQNVGYGLDKHSVEAEKLILEKFGLDNGAVFFMLGGTQVNMVTLSYLLRPYEGVIACDTAHINGHETGAVEGSGHKIYTSKNVDGKITPEDIRRCVRLNHDCHTVKFTTVYISNATESGTIYTKDELLALRKVCDELGLFLFMDGARMGVALTSRKNDVDCKLIGEVCDAFYLSGTKNGMLSGEALCFKNKKVAEDFRYQIKNKGGMLAKGFLVSSQFECAFRDDLFFRLAKNSNDQADYIKDSLKGVCEFTNDSPTNQIFLRFKKADAEKIMENFGAEPWEDQGSHMVIRLVTSFNTKKEDCDNIIEFIKGL